MSKLPLLFVTSNSHKFLEVKEILEREHGISIGQERFLFRELDSSDLREIAIDKAQQAFRKIRQPMIVEDTALYFSAYKNFPGTLPKRVFESIGYDGIFRLLKGKNRGAFFRVCFCYIDGMVAKTFVAELHGKITTKVFLPKKQRMPYERIFIPKGKNKPLVMLDIVEKNAVSHRGKAARLLGKWLQEREKEELIENL